MKAEELKKLVTGKTTAVSVRINPELLKMIDKTLDKDPEFKSRNELIEVLLLRYLESKGGLK